MQRILNAISKADTRVYAVLGFHLQWRDMATFIKDRHLIGVYILRDLIYYYHSTT